MKTILIPENKDEQRTLDNTMEIYANENPDNAVKRGPKGSYMISTMGLFMDENTANKMADASGLDYICPGNQCNDECCHCDDQCLPTTSSEVIKTKDGRLVYDDEAFADELGGRAGLIANNMKRNNVYVANAIANQVYDTTLAVLDYIADANAHFADAIRRDSHDDAVETAKQVMCSIIEK